MKRWRKWGILAAVGMTAGAVRLPLEAAFTRELRAAGLIAAPLSIDVRDRIGQTSSAVALGGLRTLVASFLNLRANSFFFEQRWSELEETYDTIVDLAPHTRYYWESGAWHLAYNSASYYLLDNRELPALRRKEAWRTAILKGRAFLERGIRNNPTDWSLHANLGFLLTDPNKFPAFGDPDATFAAAAEAYRTAAASPDAMPYVRRRCLYALARVPGREQEALRLVRELYQESPTNRLPTLLCLLLVLESKENPEMDGVARAVELFGSERRAYETLCAHWLRMRERFPVYGVAAVLQSLEQTLRVPAAKSVFRQPLPPPPGPDSWFGNESLYER